MRPFIKHCLFLTFLLLTSSIVSAYELEESVEISEKIFLFEDKENNKSIDEIIHSDAFVPNLVKVPNLGITTSSIWVRYTISDASTSKDLLIELANPLLDRVEFYQVVNDKVLSHETFGEYLPYNRRIYDHQNYIFPIDVSTGEAITVYIKIESQEQIQLPLFLGSVESTFKRLSSLDILFGIFFGIMLVMILYNLFIFVSTRDAAYLFYVMYIAMVMLLQLSFHGYSFRFFWKERPDIAMSSVYWLTAIVPILGMSFEKVFLKTHEYSKLIDRILVGFIILTGFVAIIGGIFPSLQFLIAAMAGVTALYAFFVALKMSLSGNRSAKLYLSAWGIFLIGVIIHTLKDGGILPYNNITHYTMILGVSVELVLLSFALADRINIMREEKEAFQQKTVEVLRENEKIIKEQNIILELRVTERTTELQESNTELNVTLKNLREAQSQLVDAEKMASLGQLTAGIAHEINNPINFVTSSIIPLRRDVEDMLVIIEKYDEVVEDNNLEADFEEVTELKEELELDYLINEIKSLLDGIQDGANRTAEIVKGLRIFSRVDEMDLKKANLNEGLDATLVVLNSSLSGKVTVEREYDNLPLVECQAGKINQVFMNIINNGIQAILGNVSTNGEGVLRIKTTSIEDAVEIRIKDSGIGMDKQTRQKIFEPFFTTKEVGEGTGLGLSIVHSIIEAHNGKIEVASEEGIGTEFIITLPKIHNK